MNFIERIHGVEGAKVIVGSGFFWAWFDALFMSAFFTTPESHGLMAEAGVAAAFAASIPMLAFIIARRDAAERILASRKGIIAVSACGVAGSLAYFASGFGCQWALLAIGGVLCGVYMAALEVAWGAAYCHDGARSATPYVAGAFACAPLIDVPFLLMMPQAQAVFFSLLPLVSGLALSLVSPDVRAWPKPRQPQYPCAPAQSDAASARAANAACHAENAASPCAPLAARAPQASRPNQQPSASPAPDAACTAAAPHETQGAPIGDARAFLRRYLGVSAILLTAVALVMASFGYLQHLLSFSPDASAPIADGIIMQMARGAAAIVMFFLFIAKPRLSSAVYRIGLLTMIAGVMMMPFAFGGDYFVFSGGIILAGYTAFDILIWVAFSNVAHAQSEDPIKTVAIMRLVAAAGCAVGSVAGIVLVGAGDAISSLAPQETTAVGYLIVIAVVLLMSGEGASALLRGASYPAHRSPDSPCAEAAAPREENLQGWFADAGLTARESEIGMLLAQGRTQPWIAETLGISENTVGTHVRHIYQKTGVHDRQQFIDQAISLISPEGREGAPTLTEPA